MLIAITAPKQKRKAANQARSVGVVRHLKAHSYGALARWASPPSVIVALGRHRELEVEHRNELGLEQVGYAFERSVHRASFGRRVVEGILQQSGQRTDCLLGSDEVRQHAVGEFTLIGFSQPVVETKPLVVLPTTFEQETEPD